MQNVPEPAEESGKICTPVFPVFADMQQLKSTVWYDYLDKIYGAHTLTFPIDIAEFNVYHIAHLPQCISDHIIDGSPMSTAPERPTKHNDFYTIQGFMYGPDPFIWRYMYPSLPVDMEKDPPFEHTGGIPNYTNIEVVHLCCDSITDGYWMFYAKGSGIYYNVGKTIAFPDPTTAVRHFLGPGAQPDVIPGTNLRLMRRIARRQGWDSIQLTHNRETIFKFEIEDVRTESISTCPDPNFLTITRGWGGTIPCFCSESLNWLNCDAPL
jgi:hypothetical protein